MARIARGVVPGLPHHVTQRGNRRETGVFSPLSPARRRGGAARRCSSLSLLPDAQSRPPANHARLA